MSGLRRLWPSARTRASLTAVVSPSTGPRAPTTAVPAGCTSTPTIFVAATPSQPSRNTYWRNAVLQTPNYPLSRLKVGLFLCFRGFFLRSDLWYRWSDTNNKYKIKLQFVIIIIIIIISRLLRQRIGRSGWGCSRDGGNTQVSEVRRFASFVLVRTNCFWDAGPNEPVSFKSSERFGP